MSSVKLPRLGLGTAGFALTSEAEAQRAFETALEAGIGYFDTAPLYGGGQAEVRLGKVLAGASQSVVVSTKCGRTRGFGSAAPSVSGIPDVWDFSEHSARESVERSCERLRRGKLDIVFLHDIETAQDQALKEALPVLRELQAQGRIGVVGAGCNTVDGLLAAVVGGAADALLIAGRWSLMDRTAGTQLLSHAAAHGTAIVAGGVLNSGCLAKPRSPDAKFDYRPISESERAAALDIAKVAEAHRVSVLAAALQFPGRDSRVSTTLLGASSASQLEGALAALEEQIPDQFWNTIAPMGLAA